MKKGGCFVPGAALSQLTLKWTAALGDSEVWIHLRAGCQGPAYCLMTDTLLHPSPCHSQGTRQGKALITSLAHKHTHSFFTHECGLLLLYRTQTLKGTVHLNMKILSSFTHLHLGPKLYAFLSSVEHKIRYFEIYIHTVKVSGVHCFDFFIWAIFVLQISVMIRWGWENNDRIVNCGLNIPLKRHFS